MNFVDNMVTLIWKLIWKYSYMNPVAEIVFTSILIKVLATVMDILQGVSSQGV